MRNRDVDPEKLLEMIRSILPSRARVSARKEKAGNRRVVRRRIHQALHTEDAEVTAVDLTEDAYQTRAVEDRRGADKLNHFMRWCEALTEGLSEKDAIDFVRGILPNNLIGDHALSHWEAHCKYRRGGKQKRFSMTEHNVRMRQSFADRTRARLRAAMHEDPEFLGRLNRTIKERRSEDETVRLLHGEHEIDDYVHALIMDDDPRWRGFALQTALEREVLFELLDFHMRQSGPKRAVEFLSTPPEPPQRRWP